VGTECVVDDPDKLYQNYDGEYGTCNETRCSRFNGCAFGHECWMPGCNIDTCENYNPIEKGHVFKFGVENGFRKEIAYDSNALEVIRHKLTNYFDLDREDEQLETPVGDIEDLVYVDGLDCQTCKSKSKCNALLLCKKMASILTIAINDNVEGEFENMKVKLLSGSKYVTPEIRLKLIKLLKCEKFLSKRQRDVLWLHFIEGVHQKDIKDVLSAYRCSGKGCVFFSPKKIDICPRCGSDQFVHTNITSQAVNRYIKWGLSNIRKKFLIDLDMFDVPEYSKGCVVCGKSFKTKYGHQQFCIEECRVKLYTKKRRDVRRKRRINSRKNRIKKVIKQIKCANPDCKILFIPKPFQVYHSKSCRLRVTRTNYIIHIPSITDVSSRITRR
jgi:predicted nucleic acid-binding Zn ribbon protein